MYVRTLGAGDFFGEMSLLTNEPRSATVRCETDGGLLRIHDVHVRALLARDPAAASAVAAALSRYVQAHNVALARSGGDSPGEDQTAATEEFGKLTPGRIPHILQSHSASPPSY